MPNTKISDESAATTLAGDELLLGVQSAANVKIAIDQVRERVLSGLAWKPSVLVATTTNGTLATAFESGQTVDGQVVVTGDRILLKSQTATAENGIYIVSATGAPSRAPDAAVGDGLVGAAVYVSRGTVNAGTSWVCSVFAPVTLGTTGLVFSAMGGGGGGLTNFTESTDTASPNNTVNANQLLVEATSTNADFVLRPKGSGSLVRNLPDASSTGGDKRGIYATDLQGSRTASSSVASGSFAVVVGGTENKAAGSASVCVGGSGNSASSDGSAICGGYYNNITTSGTPSYAFIGGGLSNTAYGGASGVVSGGQGNSAQKNHATVVGGYYNVASGSYSTAMGSYASTLGIEGCFAYAAGRRSTVGDAQALNLVLRVQTTDATTTRLISNTSSVAASNQLALPASAAMTVVGSVVARQSSTGDVKSWTFAASIVRNGTAATTAMVASCTPVVVAAASGASSWALSVSADTTYGALKLEVTGEASKTINWVAMANAVYTA